MTSTTIVITKSRSAGASWAFIQAWLCLLLVSTIGCGDGRQQTYPVSGTVQFSDGALVRTGYVELIPLAGGPSARGSIDRQGDFVLGTYTENDGAVAGDFIALVLQHARQIAPEEARQLGPDHAEHAGSARFVSLKHSSRATSGLSCTVQESDSNHLTLTVKAQGARLGRKK